MKQTFNSAKSVTPLCSRKMACLLASMAGLLLLTLLLREQPHKPMADETSRGQSQVESNPKSNGFPVSSMAPSRRSAAVEKPPTDRSDLATYAKRPENDESPVGRWQLGTHWGRERDPMLAA